MPSPQLSLAFRRAKDATGISLSPNKNDKLSDKRKLLLSVLIGTLLLAFHYSLHSFHVVCPRNNKTAKKKTYTNISYILYLLQVITLKNTGRQQLQPLSEDKGIGKYEVCAALLAETRARSLIAFR